jgi:hypothetical protein
MIRINVHPVGENLIHTTCTLLTPVQICHMYAIHSQSPYVATFHANPTELKGPYCSWEKWLPTQSSAHRLIDPQVRHQVFFLQHNIEAVMKVKHLLTSRLHRFTGPISPACDQYVQYLLVIANPSVRNRHIWGLQSWRSRLPHHTPRPS